MDSGPVCGLAGSIAVGYSVATGAGAYIRWLKAVAADGVYVRERGDENRGCEWEDDIAWGKCFGGEHATAFVMALCLEGQ